MEGIRRVGLCCSEYHIVELFVGLGVCLLAWVWEFGQSMKCVRYLIIYYIKLVLAVSTRRSCINEDIRNLFRSVVTKSLVEKWGSPFITRKSGDFFGFCYCWNISWTYEVSSSKIWFERWWWDKLGHIQKRDKVFLHKKRFPVREEWENFGHSSRGHSNEAVGCHIHS